MSQEKRGATWSFRCRYKDVLTNKYVNVRKTGFSSKTKAKIAEAEFLKNINITTKSKITFEQLYNDYIDEYGKHMKISSFITVKNKCENHIIPFFKNDIVENIDILKIRAWKSMITKKGLCSNYRKQLYTILNSILSHGNRYFNINNYCVSKEGNFKDSDKKKEMLFWTLDEYNQFNDVIDDILYKTLFSFLYWTGCRIGEVLALTWNDFSEGFKSVNIMKSMTIKTGGNGYVIQPPKTSSSERTISIPNKLIYLLKELNKYYKKYEGFSESCFVFGFSKPLSRTTIERYKNDFCNKASVKQIRLHDFRHSHASFLINNLPNDNNLIMAVSKRLGHRSTMSTLSTYAHMFPEKEDKLLNILNNI